jgi:hypothetical protein
VKVKYFHWFSTFFAQNTEGVPDMNFLTADAADFADGTLIEL